MRYLKCLFVQLLNSGWYTNVNFGHTVGLQDYWPSHVGIFGNTKLFRYTQGLED